MAKNAMSNYQSKSISPKYLINSRPLIVLPELAYAIGLNEAIFLQQLHFLISAKSEISDITEYKDGRLWIYNKLDQWLEKYFIFWSLSTLRRTISSLCDNGIVLKRKYNVSKSDHMLWYTIDYEKLEEVLKAFHDNEMEEILKKAEENLS